LQYLRTAALVGLLTLKIAHKQRWRIPAIGVLAAAAAGEACWDKQNFLETRENDVDMSFRDNARGDGGVGEGGVYVQTVLALLVSSELWKSGQVDRVWNSLSYTRHTYIT
jgi:hypothetical protein